MATKVFRGYFEFPFYNFDFSQMTVGQMIDFTQLNGIEDVNEDVIKSIVVLRANITNFTIGIRYMDGTYISSTETDMTINQYFEVDVFTVNYIGKGIGQILVLGGSSLISDVEQCFDFTKNVYFLYKLNSEKNVVTKSLTFVENGYIKFNTVVKPTNFEIEIKRSITDEFFNYMYISSLHRFYYVDNVDLINDAMRLTLTEDVLMSWDELIRSQDAFVTRNTNTYDAMIIDDRVPTKNVPTITYTDITGGVASNVTFNTTDFFSKDDPLNPGLHYEKRSILIVTINDNVSSGIPYDVSYNPNVTGLPKVGSIDTHNGVTYALKYGETVRLLSEIFDDDTLQSYATSCMILPFEIPTVASSRDGALYIKDKVFGSDMGLHNTPYSGTTETVQIISEIPPYLIVADYTLTALYSGYESFLNYEPFTTYEFLVPFVGWIKLSAKDVVDKHLLFYYALDYDSGSATFYVYNATDDAVIHTSNCQLGINIPINTSNREEIRRQKQNTELSTAVSLISNVIGVGVGVATGNAKGVVSGALGVGKTLASNVNARNLMLERATTKSGPSETALYVANDRILMRVTCNEPLSIDVDIFETLNGHPTNNYMSLSGLSDYTEIGEIHFEPQNKDIYSDEIDMIVNELQNGVIL